jgi:MFS transporter, putative metabolite:H+ symporter
MSGMVLEQRRSTLVFWCGCALVTAGVLAHLPMFIMGRATHYALAGTVAGSVLWGVLADVYGRRASIVLSSVMFVGISICGAMPDFRWNVGMCFMMGAAAGGLLPVAYALLAEIMPTRHRGLSLVLVGGIGAVGGYFAASFLSTLLQPTFGWRIMWLLNLPTGLVLVVLSPLLPESARFLQETGRTELARLTLARFGVVLIPAAAAVPAVVHESHAPVPPLGHGFVGITTALTLAALAWGLVNFGLLLWLPAALVAQGHSVAASSALIAKSTLLAAPTIVICAWLFSAWSTKWSLVTATGSWSWGLPASRCRGSDRAPWRRRRSPPRSSLRSSAASRAAGASASSISRTVYKRCGCGRELSC